MAWLVAKFGPKLARVVAFLIVASVVIAAMFAVQYAFTRNAKTETKLAKGQAGAAVDSGKDAVTTLGNQQAAEQATDQVTKENEDAIRKAAGANAPVAAPVRDAGLASLCRRAAYRGDPRCVQRTPAP